MVTTKSDVYFGGFTRALCRILEVVCIVSEKLGVGLVITAGSNGKHLAESKHYSYNAIDLRCRFFPASFDQKLCDMIQEELGKDFTVLHENEGTDNEHIHIQLKKGLTHWSGVSNDRTVPAT